MEKIADAEELASGEKKIFRQNGLISRKTKRQTTND